MIRLIGTSSSAVGAELLEADARRRGATLHSLRRHLGVDPAGKHRVDGNPAAGELQRKRAREADHRMLRRAVSRIARYTKSSEHG